MSSSTASKLDGLLGLDAAKRVVREVASGKTPIHAILLYGAPGSGKNVLADLLAQAWLCREPSADGGDGSCRACAAFDRGTNADFMRIEPSGPSRIIAVKAISNDKPRDEDPVPAISFFRTMPLMSRHKVVLIESAERMNAGAANALLKTLEEPHPHAKLILTTESVGSILPTILSRCLAVACQAPRHSSLIESFPDATDEELRLAEGTPGRLKHVLAHREVYARIAAFARRLLILPPGAVLSASDEIRQLSEALEKAIGGGMRAANAETLEVLAICLARDPGAPPTWTQYITESHRRIVGNGASGIVFDALMARMLMER